MPFGMARLGQDEENRVSDRARIAGDRLGAGTLLA
jgi:hypothetical protein